ncbi:XamI family restriction endonuclease [Sphingomonas sp.]|uniref:XamI family restriction endonuclease n=1 Tax=Sphingomonas sp. TaxID=28214 RepID=UPI001ECBF9E2|nr:XamI family restriction endonuclease [Sphingomonas sp.]MBX3592928.1 XamI family restriction endonuclease [Sphingomonas sp.]
MTLASAADHAEFCAEARGHYLADRNAASDAEDWKTALWFARRAIVAFLRTSNFLGDVSGALVQSGIHTLALRHFLAPPISQDQFRLICPGWPKGTEKTGKGLKPAIADAVAAIFNERRSRRMTPWIDRGRPPELRELFATISAVAPLIASQQVSTTSRQRLAALQEGAVIAVLEERRWTKLQSGIVSTGGQIPAMSFMHKTRFASGPNEAQEVDIACGLGGTVVLAMECKVTNDETNSVKRVNDVLKKAAAWKHHWGTFVRPAAVLQGVIKFQDVQRLLDAGVEVFWAHRLDLFAEWIDDNTNAG